MVFLDTALVIYLIEQPVGWGPKANACVSGHLANGERVAFSDLVRMECQVGPLKSGDARLLAKYIAFFESPDVQVLSILPTVCDRAARIRAQYGFRALDSLHLAAAVDYSCTRFVTNDARLKRFPDISVEVL